MSEAAEILVIILSIFLAMFLLLSIVLLVMLIRVTKQIQELTASAQSTVHHIEKAVSGIAKITSPLLIFELVAKQFKKFTHKDKEEEKDE